ncbi:MAG: UDP-N-acetylmuramate--L-alanine ligase [Verrucomicrobiota bacterium]
MQSETPVSNCTIDQNGAVLLGGVAGSGMTGLARMLLQKGTKVIGVDRVKSGVVETLMSQGMLFIEEGGALPQQDVGLVVCSAALSKDHPIRVYAKEKKIRLLHRAEMVAELLNDKEVILVAGTHGKTTTSVLLTHVLRRLGRDVSFYIGAEVPLFGTSAWLGTDSLAVVEADESDGSFEVFDPKHCIILNIEEDHLDFYSGIDEIKSAFVEVIKKCTGECIICADDPVANELICNLPELSVTSYGLTQTSKIQGKHWRPSESGGTVSVAFGPNAEDCKTLKLSLRGKHNVSNAVAVCALCKRLGWSENEIVESFANVTGARRRFDVLVDNAWGVVVDDYAHHPTEIKATLSAVDIKPNSRLVVVFQPHRFSRTEKLMDRFGEAFGRADHIYLAPVYGAGESTTVENIMQQLVSTLEGGGCSSVICRSNLEDLKRQIRLDWKKGDILMVMGAGDIDKLAYEIASEVKMVAELETLLGESGECLLYEPLSKHTTLRVGGPANVWVNVYSEEALGKLFYYTKKCEIPCRVIGRGSNLLAKDNGYRGICVSLAGHVFSNVEIDGTTVTAGAGVKLKELVRVAKQSGIGGFEFMEGIPGSLGGGLRMNAGAMQSWMFEVVESIRVMDSEGKISEIPRNEIEVRYRDVPLLKRTTALSAVLKGKPSDTETINKILTEYSKKRWASQPAKASPGCSFKNPGNIPAGKLIDELGLKEKKIGGAQISSVHGNFIVNDSGATAADVLELIDLVKKEAQERRGITLEPEVIVLNE